MNRIIWQEILEEAERLNLPLKNKRGILREFLQTKILGYLYEEKNAGQLQFMGGTALRIVARKQFWQKKFRLCWDEKELFLETFLTLPGCFQKISSRTKLSGKDQF